MVIREKTIYLLCDWSYVQALAQLADGSVATGVKVRVMATINNGGRTIFDDTLFSGAVGGAISQDIFVPSDTRCMKISVSEVHDYKKKITLHLVLTKHIRFLPIFSCCPTQHQLPVRGWLTAFLRRLSIHQPAPTSSWPRCRGGTRK